MLENNFGPFRLEVGLKSSAIIQGPLTLESLLAAAVNEATGLIREEALSHVPIAKVSVAGVDIWQASSVIFDGCVRHGRETIIRRVRQTEIGPEFFEPNPRARKTDPWALDQARGDFKALMNSYPTIQADSLVWYAIGDAQVCAQMVRDLMFIGKRRGQGFGEIEFVTVAKTLEDPVIDSNGLARRPLRVELLPFLTGAKPKEHQRLAYVPDQHPTWANEPRLCAVASIAPLQSLEKSSEDRDVEMFYG